MFFLLDCYGRILEYFFLDNVVRLIVLRLVDIELFFLSEVRKNGIVYGLRKYNVCFLR